MPETRQFVTEASVACGGRFDILSDIDNGYALEMGLVIWVGDRVREICARDGPLKEKLEDFSKALRELSFSLAAMAASSRSMIFCVPVPPSSASIADIGVNTARSSFRR
jgi:hypothetical protein